MHQLTQEEMLANKLLKRSAQKLKKKPKKGTTATFVKYRRLGPLSLSETSCSLDQWGDVMALTSVDTQPQKFKNKDEEIKYWKDVAARRLAQMEKNEAVVAALKDVIFGMHRQSVG
jgi:hypothetical protein